jgi:hypothetical protein
MSTSPIRIDDVAPPDQGERKFVLDAEMACIVWRVVGTRLRPSLIDPTRPITFHRTTYFDTPEFAYYRGTGPLARRLRVREYASSTRSTEVPALGPTCFLELKQSAQGMRSKNRLELTPDQVAGELARIEDGRLRPCLTTWYPRVALTYERERLRVTLDSRLVYSAPRPIGTPCVGEGARSFARGPGYILEVKAWDELPSWMVLLLRGLREAVGFSKFRGGMKAAEERGLLAAPAHPGN